MLQAVYCFIFRGVFLKNVLCRKILLLNNMNITNQKLHTSSTNGNLNKKAVGLMAQLSAG